MASVRLALEMEESDTGRSRGRTERARAEREALRAGEGEAGEGCPVSSEGRAGRAASPSRHDNQRSRSPQHPCEVGWKVAAIIMPTSTDKTGTRACMPGARAEAEPGRGGGACGWALCAAPGPESCGRAPRGSWQHTVTWTRGERSGLKIKESKEQKP